MSSGESVGDGEASSAEQIEAVETQEMLNPVEDVTADTFTLTEMVRFGGSAAPFPSIKVMTQKHEV